MIVINSHCLVVMGVNTLTMENRYSVEMGWRVPRIGCWETPYSNSGSKNGCASGPRLVHPHRRKEESSGDFLAKFPAQEKTKNAERPFLRPTSRPETGSPLLVHYIKTLWLSLPSFEFIFDKKALPPKVLILAAYLTSKMTGLKIQNRDSILGCQKNWPAPVFATRMKFQQFFCLWSNFSWLWNTSFSLRSQSPKQLSSFVALLELEVGHI